MLHTSPVTTNPADPPPPTGQPTSTTPPVPAVPYGGAVEPADPAAVSAPLTAQGVAKGVGQVAVSWGVRAIVFFIIRMIFRAIFRR